MTFLKSQPEYFCNQAELHATLDHCAELNKQKRIVPSSFRCCINLHSRNIDDSHSEKVKRNCISGHTWPRRTVRRSLWARDSARLRARTSFCDFKCSIRLLSLSISISNSCIWQGLANYTFFLCLILQSMMLWALAYLPVYIKWWQERKRCRHLKGKKCDKAGQSLRKDKEGT